MKQYTQFCQFKINEQSWCEQQIYIIKKIIKSQDQQSYLYKFTCHNQNLIL